MPGLGHGQGLAEDIALHELDAELAQRHDAGLVLDAFGDHVAVEHLGHAGDDADDLEAFAAVGHAHDEGAVDLQRVEGEAVQVRER